MESPIESEGAWVFLSHSNKDFDQVREIRNELERRGHKPLMFFLKCLESDDARLPELLKQEIAARQWFILCDSPSAQGSKWVQEEVAMIQAMEGKVFRTVDLSKGLETEVHKLVELSKRATVFLSYAYVQEDHEIADQIRRALLKHDYRVWSDSELKSGLNFEATIQLAIDDAADHGFVLLLLSPSSLASPSCKHETEYALQRAGRSLQSNVIPIVVAPFAHNALPLQLAKIQWFDLTTGPFDERIEELIRDLRIRDME
ncbi:MAG: toll/interleukin-1 receptor domain-containing protein [Fimbriimonas sp.]|nr:toll/interleukin-1 receptor domain-containing protein [Fimbriimonas sp.]